jgi:hypothetical protein
MMTAKSQAGIIGLALLNGATLSIGEMAALLKAKRKPSNDPGRRKRDLQTYLRGTGVRLVVARMGPKREHYYKAVGSYQAVRRVIKLIKKEK